MQVISLSIMVFNQVIILLLAFSFVHGCENGWVQFNDKCYLFSHTAAPWGEATSICSAFRTKLAEPMDAAQNAFLTNHAQSLGREFWIGISDIIEEDTWMYTSTRRTVVTSNFAPGEPNQSTSADCVMLWMGGHGKWADNHCNEAHTFVCEMDLESQVIG